MSVTIFLGIRLPGRPYQRVTHQLNEEAYNTFTVEHLKKVIVDEILGHCPDGVELIHCGSALDDSSEIRNEGIKSGSTIHVFQKNDEDEPTPIPLTEESIAAAAKAFRHIALFQGSTFPKAIRPEVTKKVLDKYPELYNDLGAFAILKDPVLLEKMIRSEQAKVMGEQYPLLIHSAKFVAETMINYLKTNTPCTHTTAEDSLSDSSASENDSPQASPNHAEVRRISRGQLAAALMLAGSASLNSLPNIAQSSIADPMDIPTTSTTTTVNHPPPPSSADASSSSNLTEPPQSSQYAAELEMMREIGLTEENSNLQALILCNGNVEAAINLVLGIGNFS